jgi:cob(I)alamin adenosyltransferase
MCRAASKCGTVKIYTKTGDSGQTGLFGGERVEKNDGRIEMTGHLDELNASLGVAVSLGPHEETANILLRLQSELFTFGAEVGCTEGASSNLRLTLISDEDVARLEGEIDVMTRKVPELRAFILPGGSRAAAEVHRARTVARRAERCLVGLDSVRPELLRYLNRLSDHLFTLARRENALAETSETQWSARNPKG